eukprot:TRINITY_DN254818_c0_g3_i3.p1 TRINITY_DN254818_c0_g3~~TRINITY_DN254818_c0_g3_i3.p1  ORF type:complete len:193 (-),score=20.89 TRINITY_DN254818_c0_g3_i3:236-814(-)
MSERPVVINKIMGKLQTDLVQKLLDPGPYVRIQNKSPLTFEISHDDNLIKIPVLPWFRSMCPLIAVDCDGADLNREVLKQIKSLSTENGTIFRYNMSEMDLEGTFNLNIPTETVGYCPLVVEKRGMHPFGSKWVLSLKVDSDDYKWELVRLVGESILPACLTKVIKEARDFGTVWENEEQEITCFSFRSIIE